MLYCPVCALASLIIKDLVYEAKSKTFLKAKAKDMKIFQVQDQGHLRQLPYKVKFASVTETA